jgi:hypothetical protein
VPRLDFGPALVRAFLIRDRQEPLVDRVIGLLPAATFEDVDALIEYIVANEEDAD